jgi:hypothetical protein
MQLDHFLSDVLSLSLSDNVTHFQSICTTVNVEQLNSTFDFNKYL